MSQVFGNQNKTLGYLGKNFQKNLLAHILTNKDFGSDIIKELIPQYFDDPHIKTLFMLASNYYSKYNTIPNIENIGTLINIDFTGEKDSDKVQKEILNSVLKELESLNDRNRKDPNHSDDLLFYEKNTWHFIRQQEYKKAVDNAITILKKGNLDDADEVAELFKKALDVGVKRDLGVNVYDNYVEVLEDDYRNPIPTNIPGLDEVMKGGASAGDVCLILAPSGIGKTTLLSKIGHGARKDKKNVLQIIFEDNYKDIQRKHFAMLTGIPLSELSEKKDEAREIITNIKDDPDLGELVIKKFPEGETTIPMIEDWINNFTKSTGINFDIILLDYLDCVVSHKKSESTLDGELQVMLAFMGMINRLGVPGWTAIQGNRSAMDARVVAIHQMSGNIKKAQKGHFIMSVGKEPEQKVTNTANISIIKSRFSDDGLLFENSIFDNDSLDIRLSDSKNIGDVEKKPESGVKNPELIKALIGNM